MYESFYKKKQGNKNQETVREPHPEIPRATGLPPTEIPDWATPTRKTQRLGDRRLEGGGIVAGAVRP
jgi:hypothetical protein